MQNSNGDKTQNSNGDKTQIATKLKSSNRRRRKKKEEKNVIKLSNSNCDKTKKKPHILTTQFLTKHKTVCW